MLGLEVFKRLMGKPTRGPQEDAPKVALDERVYAIGDVHGRLDLIVALLFELIADAEAFDDSRAPRFIFLGDYIDRGDQSCEVLKLLSSLKGCEPRQFDFLMGNHEAAFLSFLEDPVHRSEWLSYGGRQTLSSYGIASVSHEPDAAELISMRDQLYQKCQPHMPFLNALSRYVVSGQVVFAHASLDPALKLEEQPDAALLWGQIPSGRSCGLPGHRVVHGHFANYEPVTRPDRICVDTGAYYSGQLTAVRLDDTETFLSVSAADLI